MDDSLSYRSLFAGARKFALSAWSAHNRGEADREVFILHAGVSVERLAKAALARQSPMLLMETNAKEDLLLYFAGAVPSIGTRIRTIGAFAAITRLRKLGVLRPKDSDLDDLIELRNGVAHLAADAVQEFDPVLTFARTTTELLRHLDVAPEDYWGSMTSLVNVVLSEAHTKVEREVEIQLRAARHRFEERFRDMPEDAAQVYRSGVEGLVPSMRVLGEDVYLSHSRTCPACECPGILDAKLVPVKEQAPKLLAFEVVILSCKHCGLLVEGREQLMAAGVAYAFTMPVDSMPWPQLLRYVMRGHNPSEGDDPLVSVVY